MCFQETIVQNPLKRKWKHPKTKDFESLSFLPKRKKERKKKNHFHYKYDGDDNKGEEKSR